MKPNIHPKYFPLATISCACGQSFKIGSTVEKINTEICSNCHPFYTGKSTIIDTAGRVDRFKKRQAKAEEKVKKTLSASQKKAKAVSRRGKKEK
jgi:large subunit ribosomal protein L31